MILWIHDHFKSSEAKQKTVMRSDQSKTFNCFWKSAMLPPLRKTKEKKKKERAHSSIASIHALILIASLTFTLMKVLLMLSDIYCHGLMVLFCSWTLCSNLLYLHAHISCLGVNIISKLSHPVNYVVLLLGLVSHQVLVIDCRTCIALVITFHRNIVQVLQVCSAPGRCYFQGMCNIFNKPSQVLF